METLSDDYFVPGHCLCGPQVTDPWWREAKAGILCGYSLRDGAPTQTVSAESCMVWAERVYYDHVKKAPPNSKPKQKAAVCMRPAFIFCLPEAGPARSPTDEGFDGD